MASPLFRIHNVNLAGCSTGSRETVGLKMAVHRHMNVEIGTEAAQFPEKEYINGIAVAVLAP
jgi:hypothetical protein